MNGHLNALGNYLQFSSCLSIKYEGKDQIKILQIRCCLHPGVNSGKWHLQHVVNNKINIYRILKVDRGNKV